MWGSLEKTRYFDYRGMCGVSSRSAAQNYFPTSGVVVKYFLGFERREIGKACSLTLEKSLLSRATAPLSPIKLDYSQRKIDSGVKVPVSKRPKSSPYEKEKSCGRPVSCLSSEFPCTWQITKRLCKEEVSSTIKCMGQGRQGISHLLPPIWSCSQNRMFQKVLNTSEERGTRQGLENSLGEE